MPLIQLGEWAYVDGRYRNRFIFFWNVLVTIRLFSIVSARSRKLTSLFDNFSSGQMWMAGTGMGSFSFGMSW